MVQFEYFPQLIEAHRNDLRALAQPLPSEIATRPWRRVVGERLVQLGRWVEGNRPTIVHESPAVLGKSSGAA
jgi:hypothetical protein